MKEFWKDYGKLCKDSVHFYKNHWKGVIVLNAVIVGVEAAYLQHRYKLFNLNSGVKTEEENEAQ